ncbi:MAG: serine/threonine-protein phosphatase, partial [Phycisphaerae bacterium]|nr:serine/threonine-protein phosphatase [Phycisphaerae bacterium]
VDEHMAVSPHVLLLDQAPRLSKLVGDELKQRGFSFDARTLEGSERPLQPGLADLAVVVLDQHHALADAGGVLNVLEELTRGHVPTLVWGLPERAGVPTAPLLDCVSGDASLSEVMARLTTLGHFAPQVRRLERELDNLKRLGNQFNRYFSEIDQELRLAGRLQRDFLPAKLPQIPPLTFASMYRPASWVSGDMYDVIRIDEQHVGLFVTDAMGHGIAAGLLTMFLRQALVAKRIAGRSYQVVGPAEAMANLNNCLVRQKLPNCQFVTALYGIIDAETLVLRVARGGHPYPAHIRADGTIRELPVPGGLLGVPDLPADFGENRVKLEPGDKVIFYTDGIEDVFRKPVASSSEPAEFTDLFRDLSRLDVHEFMQKLNIHLDGREGSLHPADDMTVLAMEVAG